MFGAALLLLAVAALPASASVADPFPSPRPATRDAALVLVAGGEAPVQGCLSPRIDELRSAAYGANPVVARTLILLRHRSFSGGEQLAYGYDGTRILYTTESSAFDRIATADVDADGRADLLEQVRLGLSQARDLLVEQLRLPAPNGLEVLLLELGPGLDGYVVPGEGGSAPTIVLDASPSLDGDGVRRAAIHQYAHAVALTLGPRFPAAWGEALATWAAMTLEDQPDTLTVELLSERIKNMAEGLEAPDSELAAGNALWFAFLEQQYGLAAVSVTAQELSRGVAVPESLDRALRRVSEHGLKAAFREYQLWTVLVGKRADRFHFSFADQLTAAGFASAVDGLPALSVQSDPSLGSWGATQIRIRPDSRAGGLRVRFEGEFSSTWEADLLLVEQDDILRRVGVELSAEGRGEITVPLGNLEEALLLVRHLDSEDGSARRYTYAVHRERGFPFELASFEAAVAEGPGHGVEVVWQTAMEQQLVGFNILRVREDGGSEVVINPTWVPAMGDSLSPTHYHFLDRTAEEGVSYLYRVQGITREGLTSESDPVMLRQPAGR